MRVFYKSFLFLTALTALFLAATFFLLEIRFLIPTALLLICLNLFLCFFAGYFIKKNYRFSHFPKDDFYGASALFEEFKKKNGNPRVQLLKSEEPPCLYWSGLQGSVIALSEDFLESFNKEQTGCFFAYAFKKIKSGDLFFFSLLSSFLYLTLKPASILGHPLFFKRGKKERNFLEKGLIKLLSLTVQPLFYKTDKELFKTPEQKREQALFLWNLESFTRLKKQKTPLFLSPLCLIDPLAGSFEEENQTVLQPRVKNRLKKLIKTYPP